MFVFYDVVLIFMVLCTDTPIIGKLASVIFDSVQCASVSVYYNDTNRCHEVRSVSKHHKNKTRDIDL